ncbi:MAG: cation:proton antiporter [Paludibacter sp.]|nr:cation:proton antiporter [Paludibacter sp.]
MSRKHLNTWIFYLLMIVSFVLLTYVLFNKADRFEVYEQHVSSIEAPPLSDLDSFKLSVHHNLAEPLGMLLLQIIAILIVSRIVSWFFAKIGQPTVIGEILAGILLGPSLLGYFYPETYQFLFAAETLDNLYILSQVGLVLFMFVIGMELNLGMLRNKMGSTYVISHASIIIPYFLGMLFAYYVFEEFAAGQTDFLSFALFIGISMSITAFPVLARIVQEKGLSKTHLGSVSIMAAAFNDVTAWCLLAAVIAIAKTGSFVSSLYTIGISIVYVVFMFYVIRPFMKKIGSIYSNSEVLNKNFVAFLFLLLTLSAFATHAIGIHALFGAFLVGVIMPELPTFRKLIIEKLEDVSLSLLLPLFFVYTGLRTEIGLLNTPHLWSITALLIGFAVVGKFAGSAIAARITGENWRDSLSMGALMNTRGLMEIVVLNIGYEMGILPKTIFVMLVLMAIVTTFMTTPLLALIQKIFPQKQIQEEYKRQQARGVFKALIALGNPENGKALLNVARYTLDGAKNILSVTALHITPGSYTNPIYGEDFAEESFKNILSEAERLKLEITTEHKFSDIVEQDLIRTVNSENYDFLLVGAGVSLSGISFEKKNPFLSKFGFLSTILSKVNSSSKEIFYPGSLIKDKTKYFVEHSKCSVGIFINRNFESVQQVLVLIQDVNDDFLIRYAHRLLKNNPAIQLTIQDEEKLIQSTTAFQSSFRNLIGNFPNSVRIVRTARNNYNHFGRFSLMLVSYLSWNQLTQRNSSKLENIPSTLIINKKESRFSSSGHSGSSEVANLKDETH